MKVGIAAQQNVGAAAGHVRGDGHGAFAPGLRDDLGFPLVLLGVQDVVFDAVAAQEAGEASRISRWKWCRPGPAGRVSWHSLISSTIAANFSFSVR